MSNADALDRKYLATFVCGGPVSRRTYGRLNRGAEDYYVRAPDRGLATSPTGLERMQIARQKSQWPGAPCQG